MEKGKKKGCDWHAPKGKGFFEPEPEVIVENQPNKRSFHEISQDPRRMNCMELTKAYHELEEKHKQTQAELTALRRIMWEYCQMSRQWFGRHELPERLERFIDNMGPGKLESDPGYEPLNLKPLWTKVYRPVPPGREPRDQY
jgi:hypothetical protein